MDIFLNKTEDKLFDLAKVTANELNVEAYVIGGFVRDKLLNRNCKDIDIVCVGDGIKFAEKMSHLIPTKPHVAFFSRFGTAMFKFNGIEVEFVGARKESYSIDSRKPEVQQGTIEDDQKRRDFTINALAIGLNQDNYGKLIDPFGGLKHLKEKIIKTPLSPDTTFSDDPLRMLRAIRFATQLNFQIDDDTFQSIVRNANRLNIISMERITSEFDKIMCSAKPSIGIKLLFDAGLLQYFFPELCDLQGVKVVNGIGHKDNFYHTLEVLDSVALKSDNVWLRWAALLHDIAKPPTQRFEEGIGWTFHGHEILGASMAFKIFKRLRLPLDHKLKYVQKMINLHLRPISLTKEEITDSAIRRLLVDAGDDIDDLMILCESDITSKNEKKVSKYLKNYEKVRQKLKDVEEKDHLRNWQPPIDGDIIMKVFNLSPNKEVGIIKNAIREAILNGDIENNFDEAYNFMIDKGKQIGLHAIHPII